MSNKDEEKLEQIQNIEQQSSRQPMQGTNKYVKVDKLALEL